MNALEKRPIMRIPKKFPRNAIGMNHFMLIFESPKSPIPISSGRGEAIISPPTKNVRYLKSKVVSKL